jgi:hypothetical protein
MIKSRSRWRTASCCLFNTRETALRFTDVVVDDDGGEEEEEEEEEEEDMKRVEHTMLGCIIRDTHLRNVLGGGMSGVDAILCQEGLDTVVVLDTPLHCNTLERTDVVLLTLLNALRRTTPIERGALFSTWCTPLAARRTNIGGGGGGGGRRLKK